MYRVVVGTTLETLSTKRSVHPEPERCLKPPIDLSNPKRTAEMLAKFFGMSLAACFGVNGPRALGDGARGCSGCVVRVYRIMGY